MCGILGSINNQNIRPYSQLIKHRGPDASGSVSFNIDGNRIDFLHRRLSIVDLGKTGGQPMFSYDNKCCIIFNGEIFNHNYLKNKLKDIHFKGHSDTETIVNYLRKFDIKEKLTDLNGIFSFALIDVEKKLLYLARDRFGVKPLYYTFKNNQVLFSSEIRPIKALLNPEIDRESLINCLRMRYTPSPSTIYQNVYKVEPGQLLKFNLKGDISLIKTYFIKNPPALGGKKGDYAKLVQEYGDLFEKAVERQLMSDVEVGILLSGGIDSALIAAISKQKCKTRLKAFTIGFEGSYNDIDETDLAKQTATILNLEHFHKKIDFPDLLKFLGQITNIVEEPIGTTSIIPMYFLSELAASKVKVVLSGQGADEPLGGYNKYKGLRWLEYSRLFKESIRQTKHADFLYNKTEKIRRILASMQCQDNLDSFVEFNSIYSIKQVVDLMIPSSRKAYTDMLQNRASAFKQTWRERTPHKSKISNLFLYYDMRTSLADDLLMYTDKITMHFSLECRVPILDNDLIAFIESLDIQYKFNATKGKIIHKDFAKEYLPSTIIDRKKLGFKTPTEAWFRKNEKSVEKILSDKAFCEWFDINAIKNLLAHHRNGRNMEKQIFLLLSICYILRHNENMD